MNVNQQTNVKFSIYKAQHSTQKGMPVMNAVAVVQGQTGVFDSNLRTVTPSVQNLGDSNRSIEAMLFVVADYGDLDLFDEGTYVKITHKLHPVIKRFVANTNANEQYLIIGRDENQSASARLVTLYLARKDSG